MDRRSTITRAIICCLFFASSIQVAFADLREVIAKLEEDRNLMRDHFSAYVSESYHHSIGAHFSRVLEDHRKTAYFSKAQLVQSAIQLKEKKNEWTKLANELNPGTSSFFDNWYLLASMGSFFEREIDRVGKNIADLRLLEDLWKDRCSISNLKKLESQYLPSSMYPQGALPQVSQMGTEEVVRVNLFPFLAPSSSLPLPQTHPEPSSVFAPMPLGFDSGNRTNAAVVAGNAIMGSVGGIIFGGASIILDIFEKAERARLLNLRWDLIREIQSVWSNVISEADRTAYAYIESTCANFLDVDLSKVINNGLELGSAHLEDLMTEQKLFVSLLDEINKKFQEHLSYLEGEYFPQLREQYLQACSERFVQLRGQDEEVMSFIMEEMSPLISDVVSVSSEDWESKLDSRYLLWSKVIEGRSLFSSAQVGHSSSSESSVYESYWDHFLPEVTSVLLNE